MYTLSCCTLVYQASPGTDQTIQHVCQEATHFLFFILTNILSIFKHISKIPRLCRQMSYTSKYMMSLNKGVNTFGLTFCPSQYISFISCTSLDGGRNLAISCTIIFLLSNILFSIHIIHLHHIPIISCIP